MTQAQVAPLGRLPTALALICVAIVSIFFLTRGPDEPVELERRGPESYVEEYGGDVGKYEAILRLTDCGALGRMFADGKANFDANALGDRDLWLGQMAVTDDRMDELGCP